MTVLCLIEIDVGCAADASIRAATVASALAASAGEDLAAAWFGPPDAVDHHELSAAGIARAYAIESDDLSGYAPLAWARALAGLAAGLPGTIGQVSAVVAASTDHGNEVLAHLGAITGLPMAANCVSASSTSPSEVRLVRQRWGGSLLEEAVLAASPALLTVAADAVAPQPPPTVPPPAAPVWSFRPELEPEDLLVVATASADRPTGVSLATARVVVGGGRGVGSAEGFAGLEELAGLLGAAVGVSRVVTSQGWRPHQQQVGQTGTKITPELYLACGISGAIQHMAGCQGAKNIVAINTDANAPIIARANYAVIGDLHHIIPALIAALQRRASINP
jgi:electron transfer flavoprotein alpha subunit